ncbi:MAG: efflux RND transporter periplasmic adaptor subunit [Gemmatimonadaceae bacterium]|nr:efflux RND transporter periplasmic adaptor subunit [Gemmatimonadaceae bacterium]
MRRRTSTRALACTLLVTLHLPMLTACKTKHEAEEESFRLVASNPLQRDVTVTREYVCQVQSNRHIELRALERGYIERVSVNEGQRVRTGQPMFQILPLTYQAEQQKANAEVAAARVELDNTKRLADGNVVSPAELALAEAHYKKAQAEERLAQAHLGFTDVKAPFEGLMDRLNVREGSLVEEGELLTTISDNSRMWVYFNVPEAEYLAYASRPASQREEPVRLRMANREIFKEPGKITVIEADFNNETGTIPFRADFANPTGLLRHGQTCNILLDSPVKGAVLIPQKSTFEVLDHTYVFVIDKNGVVHQQLVHVREGLEDLFIVDKGLASTDVLLIEGLRQVHDGEKVKVEMVSTDKVFANLKLHSE